MKKQNESPLIFIHYGLCGYLARALRSALRSNSDKAVVFIGDNHNKILAKAGVHFFEYSKFDSPSIAEFTRVFKPLEGARHQFKKLGGTTRWLEFVFRRWFVISEFLRREKIERFWTFDSDTMILAPLAPREQRFSNYEATSQCRDCCLNGFIGSPRLVKHYTACMLDLFRDEHYLAIQRERLERQTGLAFNEMDAFCEFRRRENVQTFHAAQPLQGEFFDDALAHDANFEASQFKVAGRIQVKRLWSSPDNALYAKHLQTGQFVRMVTCNLSWLPDYVWKRLARFSLTPEQDARVKVPVESELREVNLSQPFVDKVATLLKRKVFEVRRALGR